MNISVLIPAYNESDNIKHTIESVLAISRKIGKIDETQIIVIDDHSSDNTYEIAKKMNVSCLRLSRRSGFHVAVRAGMMNVKGELALYISADGQEDISCLPEMLKKWRKGVQIIWAMRKDRDNESWYIRIPATLFYRILHHLLEDKNSHVNIEKSDFALLDRKVVDAINSCTERSTSFHGLLSWLGFRQDFVEYDRQERLSGKSKWSLRSRLRLAKDWIIAFSGLPLKLMTVVGFIVAFLGFLYALYLIVNFFLNIPPEGWSSLMVVILILGGMQMVMFGIVGEYLWRNLDEVRKRPLYFIEKSTDEDDGG
ncbi:MAG: glycosyltransferase [Candidatus Scalindua sp.]|jgi:polyisoprenyl-phosphate glycosyltransferase|nr:glycosyltransferase [Candidatus Scalindua sp.]MBT6229067.1 glycosyltransferase [Candidatus Scalindua sp.]MBT6671648.1 glycosyltransferase [Lentimicrobiaceae bacterium]